MNQKDLFDFFVQEFVFLLLYYYYTYKTTIPTRINVVKIDNNNKNNEKRFLRFLRKLS